MRLEFSHNYQRQEVAQRVDGLLNKLQDEYRSFITNLEHTWNNEQTKKEFSLIIYGIKISGTITLIDSPLIIEVNLPLAARFMQKEVEEIVRHQIEASF